VEAVLAAGDAYRAADDVARQVGERMVVVAGVAARGDECLVGGHLEPLGAESLGLR